MPSLTPAMPRQGPNPAGSDVPADRLVTTCLALRDTPALAFNVLIEVTAADYLPREPRFEVVYFFYSLSRNEHVRLKVRVSEDDPEIPTICHVYQGANWSERLVWDFYGIRFKGHGDLRRMLLYEEFKGHPLRKDYAMRDRQPLVPERPIKDIFRGPGTNGAT